MPISGDDQIVSHGQFNPKEEAELNQRIKTEKEETVNQVEEEKEPILSKITEMTEDNDSP